MDIVDDKKSWKEKFTKQRFSNSQNKGFQFWRQDNHPIKLLDSKMMSQKLDYIHTNPVEAGYCLNYDTGLSAYKLLLDTVMIHCTLIVDVHNQKAGIKLCRPFLLYLN
jgi:hypothetical protein